MAYAGSIGLQRCEWQEYVPETDLVPSLLRARVLVATQRPETRGLLWPSKLALLERLPRPVLYVGPTDGAIAGRLRRRAGTGVFAPGQAAEVAAWIEGRQRDATGGVALETRSASNTLADGCRRLENWLSEISA